MVKKPVGAFVLVEISRPGSSREKAGSERGNDKEWAFRVVGVFKDNKGLSTVGGVVKIGQYGLDMLGVSPCIDYAAGDWR
jgi:hypothetical protein